MMYLAGTGEDGLCRLYSGFSGFIGNQQAVEWTFQGANYE